MTTLKVNVVRRPQIKVKVLPNFPSSVTVTSPILLSRAGGNYAFSFDPSAISLILNADNITLGSQTGTGALVRATSPSLVTPALGTPSSGVATNLTGLPLSGLLAQAAFTFAGNNTSGSAVPTAVNIAALTTKSVPSGTDYMMLSDQAASGAWKKATISSLGGGSGSILYASDYGVQADYRDVTGNTSITSGTPNLTLVGAAFVSTDAGKMIQVPGAGAAGVTLATTILAFVDATHVTLAANASTTLSAVSKTVLWATNDYTNFQAFLTALNARGGIGITKPGKMFISGNDPLLSMASGLMKVVLLGYGTIIKTDPLQGRTALQVQNAAHVTRADDVRHTLVAGLSIDQFEDPNAVGGIHVFGSPRVTLRDINVISGADVATPSAGYVVFGFFQSNITDTATGCFWGRIEHCHVSGGTNKMGCAVFLRGAQNDMSITNCAFSNATYGVRILTSGGGAGAAAAYLPNGVQILHNAFEGVTNGVFVDGTAGTSRILGLEIAYNRIESISSAFYNNVLTTSGGTENEWPTVLGPNYVDSGAIGANYVYNPNALPLGSRDYFIGSATINPASLAANATATLSTITVANAAAGDFAEVTANGDLLGLVLTGTAGSGIVTPRLSNPTTGAVDLGSMRFTARVRKNY